jgi:putative tryptophan/tyrosine transport system substrate-binding protein
MLRAHSSRPGLGRRVRRQGVQSDPFRYFVNANGLICYLPVIIDQYQRAAGYLDRFLKAEKPADLPAQAPTKYETVINVKTAK